MLMLMGLIRPTSGSAQVAGYDVAAQREEVLRCVGYLPERPGFYEALSARENLAYFGALSGLQGKRLAERIDVVIQQVGLTGREDQKVKTYSHGMRQRLALAAALLADPKVLILDEPTSGLDPQGTHDIRGIVRSLGGQGKTIFLSSHLLSEVQQICDTVGIIHQGRLRFVAPMDELLASVQDGITTINITLDSIDAPLLSVVRSVNGVIDLTCQNNTILVKGIRRAGLIQEINACLVLAGGRVHSLGESTPSLEEAFLEIVRRQS